ncbi:MAG: hypothetical protein ACK4UJ_01135 [Leptonema sp. (in: bacteria)]
MKYIKGNSKSPTGVLIAFSEVIGVNPIEPNAKILAVQVVVSPLSAHQYNYPVVVFPVSAYSDKNHFFKIVEFIGNCDVIQLPDFQIPKNQDKEEYLKERMKILNEIIQEYVDNYQRKYANSIQEQDLAIFDYLLDIEEINLYKTPSKQSKIKRKKYTEKQVDVKTTLKEIEDILISYNNNIQVKKLNKKKKPDEEDPKPIRRGRRKKLKLEDFSPYIAFIKKYHPELDIFNFEKAVENNNLNLANLYIKKFYAILDERYETAQYFQNKIQQLEKK